MNQEPVTVTADASLLELRNNLEQLNISHRYELQALSHLYGEARRDLQQLILLKARGQPEDQDSKEQEETRLQKRRRALREKLKMPVGKVKGKKKRPKVDTAALENMAGVGTMLSDGESNVTTNVSPKEGSDFLLAVQFAKKAQLAKRAVEEVTET